MVVAQQTEASAQRGRLLVPHAKRRAQRVRQDEYGRVLRAFQPVVKLDGNAELNRYCETLERVCVATVESGSMTKDLALLVGDTQGWLTTEGFIDKVAANLEKALAA